jgi:hypothetical protein
VDASGNVYLTGWYGSHTIIFDSITLTNAGQNDMFLVKYDATGNVLWAKSIGGTGDDFGYSAAVDAWGYVYVTGYFESPSITFGSFTLPQALSNGSENSTVLLAKFDSNGTLQWTTNAAGTGGDYGNSVAVAPEGNVYVTGYFKSTIIIFGSDTLTNAGTWDMFLVKYDGSGTVLWAKSAGGAYYDGGLAVAVDAIGDAYVTGLFESPTITFGSYELTNAGSAGYSDMFLVKYDNYGNVVWAKSAGGTGIDEGYSVAVDVSGNAYVTGSFSSSAITFDSNVLMNAGYDDIFLVKINASGNVRWAESLGGTSSDEGYSVAVDDAGNVYLTGRFFSPTIAFGSYSLTNTGKANMFLAKSKCWNAGINELDNSLKMSVYPIPATERLMVGMPAGMAANFVSIMNIDGQELLRQEVKESHTIIDVSSLPGGVYFVKVTGEQSVLVKKFIKN